MICKIYFISLWLLIVNLNLYEFQQVQSTTPFCERFIGYCNREFVQNEPYYTGKCYLRDAYPPLIDLGNYINKADDSWTIDYFIRNYLLIGATDYYREAYQGVVEPKDLIKALNDLIFYSEIFLDEFKKPNMLSTKTMFDLTQPVYDSSFNEVFQILPKLYPDWKLCQGGSRTFCGRLNDLFSFRCTFEFSQMVALTFFQAYFDRVFEFVKGDTPLLSQFGKLAIDSFLASLEEQGTLETSVGQLKNFTNSFFYRQIAEYNSFDDLPFTRPSNPRPSVTTNIVVPTFTTRQKVVDVTAINIVVLYTVPALLVLFGFAAAVAIIAIFYSFRPVSIHVKIDSSAAARMEGETDEKREKIEMQNTNV